MPETGNCGLHSAQQPGAFCAPSPCRLQTNPADVIILEGVLAFHDSDIRSLMNMKIFVDTGEGKHARQGRHRLLWCTADVPWGT